MYSRGRHGKSKKKQKSANTHHYAVAAGQRGDEEVPDCSGNAEKAIESEDEICLEFSSDTFAVKRSHVLGRYMVAARDLKPNETILCEKPLVIGPCAGCQVQCIACYRHIEEQDNYTKCSSCEWPLCSASCKGLWTRYGHTKEECKVLTECKSSQFLDYSNFASLRQHFNCIVPLRCFLLKDIDTAGYRQLMSMENHDVIRRRIPEVWDLNQCVSDRIVRDWKLPYAEADVHSMCGVLEVNAFEIGQRGFNIRGLYPSAFLMSHNCIPNTSHCDEDTDYMLSVRASVPIKTHEAITLSYAYTLQSTLKRREHLQANKFFACTCARCSDKCEMGTFIGALRCPKCPDGLVLSDDPLDANAAWRCNNDPMRSTSEGKSECPGYTIDAKAMDLLTNRIGDEMDAIGSNDVRRMEIVLEKYRNVLHPNHYLNLEVKLTLSQVYGKIHGYVINELSDEQLRRKLEVCKDILRVFDVIEPGCTRIRGVTLYELHAPVLILTTRQFERHLLSRQQLRGRLRDVVRYLEEACAILGNEPSHSPEGMMGIAAKDALVRMREWLLHV